MIFVALILAGCAAPETIPVTHFVCPDLKSYTEAEEARASQEADAIQRKNPQSQLLVMLTDYARERAAIRACKEKGL